mmetsp:Transcript_14005/g.15948  ORF Transcript_14005/g.15948 Transcript_14005/m.15948 type:complete len:92 (-) Transcript_14005:1499-1774(-)
MADSNSSLSTSVAIGAGIMALIGAVDTVFDEGLAHNSVRTGWKTLLGCAGIGLNILAFTKPGGKFEDQTHLGIYVAAIAVTTTAALYSARK